MDGTDNLDRGRECFDRRAWGDAFDALLAADAATELDPEDVEWLAIAAYMTGRDHEHDQFRAQAHRLYRDRGAVDRAVKAAFWLGLLVVLRGDHARGGGWLARARGLLDDLDEDAVEHGYLLLPGAFGALGHDPADSLQTCHTVLGIAHRCGDPDLAAFGTLGRGQAQVALGQTDAGLTSLDEAMVAVATDAVSPVVVGIVYCAVILACREAFDLERAQQWTWVLDEWTSSQQDLVPYRGQCMVHRSQLLQLRGDWTAALDEVVQARDHLAQRPHDPVLGMAMYQQAELHRLRGEFTAADACYRGAVESGHSPHPGLALLRLAQGRRSDAAAAIRRVVEDQEGQVAHARILSAAVQIMLATDDVEAATAAADELATVADDIGTPMLDALARDASGSVLLAGGDPRTALDHFRNALSAWMRLEAPHPAAQTRVQVAAACTRLGDLDTARLELAAARRTFERLEATPDLARLDESRGHGSAQTPGGLTAREVEVLGLVAGGQTNRSIANELVISEHTVARHLQNIFVKLDVTSRTAAAAFAYEHDLVPGQA